MEFHIGRNGQTLGPFSAEQVRRQLSEGKLSPRDLAWHEGADDWKPIDTYSELMLGAQEPAPVADARPPNLPPAGGASRNVWSPPQAALSTDEASGDVVEGRDYAGFWKRFAALLIDRMILFVAMVVVGMIGGVAVAGLSGSSNKADATIGIVIVAIYGGGILAYLLYCVLMESSRHQATLGKMALGIVVTDLDGRRITLGRAVGRWFATFINNFPYFFYVGWMMAGWTARKQGLHDMIAGTLVLTREPTYAGAFRAPTAATGGGYQAASSSKGMPAWAIVLIIGGVSLPVLGILLAIAIPAYQDYTIRARISEGLNAAGPYKTAITESYLTERKLPDSLEGQGLSFSNGNVRSIDWVDHLLVITYKGSAFSDGSDALALQPFRTADGNSIAWRCGFASPPSGAISLSEDDSSSRTSLASKFLPANCRYSAR